MRLVSAQNGAGRGEHAQGRDDRVRRRALADRRQRLPRHRAGHVHLRGLRRPRHARPGPVRQPRRAPRGIGQDLAVPGPDRQRLRATSSPTTRSSGVGPRADDTIPNMNAAEIMLTESYRLRFEGHPLAVSADGLIVQIPDPQGEPGRAGDVVAILSGPGGRAVAAGRPGDRRPTRTCSTPPCPPATTPSRSRPGSSMRRSAATRSTPAAAPARRTWSWPATTSGPACVDNHFLGGGFRLCWPRADARRPSHWGWSHAPMLGADDRRQYAGRHRRAARRWPSSTARRSGRTRGGSTSRRR